MDGNMAMILGIIAVVFVVVCVFLSFVPLGLWISALSSGVHVSMGALIGMKIRHIKPHRLVQPLIKANKAGLGLNISQLETHFLAGGKVGDIDGDHGKQARRHEGDDALQKGDEIGHKSSSCFDRRFAISRIIPYLRAACLRLHRK